jgi:exo-1,4-beta-D-glucosaminidase
VPPIESLKRFLPREHLWPIDEVWSYHSGGMRFTNLNVFVKALDERYGRSESLEDFERKAQAAAYEGERAMFEAYARNKYQATGVIQWMLNNAWPSLIWHLYDYYLTPAGGYFGTKKACEAVHVQYSYDDGSIVVVNNQDAALAEMTVTAKVYTLEGKEKLSRSEKVSPAADSSTRVFVVPEVAGVGTIYFLKLTLTDAEQHEVSENFYWLSTKRDVLDWPKRLGTAYTPETAYADLKGLAGLPQVRVALESRWETDAKAGIVRVRVKNQGGGVAFMVRLWLTKGADGEDVAPILWSDNYISLLPGEEREVTGSYTRADAGKPAPVLHVAGWNVAEVKVE